MRRTNRVPQTVLWSFLLGLALGNTATAQQPPAQPQPIPPPAPVKDDRVGVRTGTIVVPINGTQRVQLSNRGRIERVINPKESVVRISPILGDPTSVLATGLDAGVSRITLFGEGGVQETVEIVVQFDVEYLRTLLARAVPTAAVQPIPGSNNTIILTGTVAHAEDVPLITRTAASVVGGPERIIDAMRVGGVMQVQLDTVVAHVNRSAMRAMGFNLLQSGPSAIFGSTIGQLAPIQTAGTVPPSTFSNNGAGAASGSSSGSNSQTGLITGGSINSAPGNANLFLGVVTKSGSFFGFLEAMRDEGLAKLLTEPRVVTLSGRPASLHSGGQQAIPQPQGLGTVGVTFQPFGTDVRFLPIVLGNGKINLDVEAIVSQLNQAFGTSIQGTQVPGRDDQTVHAVVELEDGQTLAIGGLIQHRADAMTNKVPILGDLPYLGAAFSVKAYTDVEEELVILVTPHLVDPMSCNQLPKLLPGEETRKPDDYELFLEGILEAPRGSRVPFPDRHFVPAYKNGPTAGLFPCASDGRNGRCGPQGQQAAMPISDPPAPVSKPPVAAVEAKPVPPVAATPPTAPTDAGTTSSATNPPPNAAPPAEADKQAPLPASPASTDGKQ